MDFSISALAAGFVFGVIGWYLIKRGRNLARPALVVVGVVLMAYPYFVENPYLLWGVGIVLTGISSKL